MSREQGGSGSGSFNPWLGGTGAPRPQGQGGWRRGQASDSGVPQQGSRSTINQGQGRAPGPQRYSRHSSGNQAYQHPVPQQTGHQQRRYQVENQRHGLQAQAATSNQPRSAGDVGTPSRRNHSAGPLYQGQPVTHPWPIPYGNYDFSRQVPPAPYNYGPQQQGALAQQQVRFQLQLLQRMDRQVIQQFMETSSSISQGQQPLNMLWTMGNQQLHANSGIQASGNAFTQRSALLSGTGALGTSDGPERPAIFKDKYAATYTPRPVMVRDIPRKPLHPVPNPPALVQDIQVYDIDDDSDEASDSASMSPASAMANENNRESGNVPKAEETIPLETALNEIAKADETTISADFEYHPKADPAKIREAENKIFLPQFDNGCTMVVNDRRCDIFMHDELAHHQKEAEECSNGKSVTEAAATVTEASNNHDSVVQEDPVALVSYDDSDCEDLPPSHPATRVETTSSGNMQQAEIGNFNQLEQGGGETNSDKDNGEDDSIANKDSSIDPGHANTEAIDIFNEGFVGDSQSADNSACTTTNNDGDSHVELSTNPDLDDSSSILNSKQEESRFVDRASSVQYEPTVAHESADFEKSSSAENMTEDLDMMDLDPDTIISLTGETEDYEVSEFTTSMLDALASSLERNETVASTTEDHVSNVQSATEVRDEDTNAGEFVEKQNPVIPVSEENVADPVPGCSKAISASVGIHEEVEDDSYTEDFNDDTILINDRASSEASVTNFEPVDGGMEGSVDPSVVEAGWSSNANCVRLPQNQTTFISAAEPTVSGIPPFVETGLEQVRAKGLVSAALIGLFRKRNYQVPRLPRLMKLKREWAGRAPRHPRQDQRSVMVSYVRSLVVTREEFQKAKICFIGPGYLRSFLAGQFTAFFNPGPESIYLRNSENLEKFLDHNDKVEDDRSQVGKFVYLIDCDKRVEPMEIDQIMTDLTLLTGRIKFTAQLLVVYCRSKRNTSWENIQSMEDLSQIQTQFSVETRNLFKDDPTYVRALLKTLKKSLEMNVLGITQEILKPEFRRAIQPQP